MLLSKELWLLLLLLLLKQPDQCLIIHGQRPVGL
jgi:hypothetical protein